MTKRKRVTGGAPAWMVTFADMMALLLCLFVLLLSFSTMDVQKFKRIAGEMREAFGLSIKSRLENIMEIDGRPDRSSPMPPVEMAIDTTIDANARNAEAQEEAQSAVELPASEEAIAEARANRAASVAAELTGRLASEIESGSVSVQASNDGVQIRFDSNLLFASGSAQIYGAVSGLIDQLGSILAQTEGEILVSGHTDNVPISTSQFRSNWDLSAARAASLVLMLLREGKLSSSRIAAVGYADSRPIADNGSEEDRARNRRVEIQLRLP